MNTFYSTRAREAHERWTAALPGLGWRLLKDGRWRSPRGHRLPYDVRLAITIEQMRGGIRSANSGWRICGPFDRPTGGGRPKGTAVAL